MKDIEINVLDYLFKGISKLKLRESIINIFSGLNNTEFQIEDENLANALEEALEYSLYDNRVLVEIISKNGYLEFTLTTKYWISDDTGEATFWANKNGKIYDIDYD